MVLLHFRAVFLLHAWRCVDDLKEHLCYMECREWVAVIDQDWEMSKQERGLKGITFKKSQPEEFNVPRDSSAVGQMIQSRGRRVYFNCHRWGRQFHRPALSAIVLYARIDSPEFSDDGEWSFCLIWDPCSAVAIHIYCTPTRGVEYCVCLYICVSVYSQEPDI